MKYEIDIIKLLKKLDSDDALKKLEKLNVLNLPKEYKSINEYLEDIKFYKEKFNLENDESIAEEISNAKISEIKKMTNFEEKLKKSKNKSRSSLANMTEEEKRKHRSEALKKYYYNLPLEKYFNGEIKYFPKNVLMDRLIEEKYLDDCCSICGFREKKIGDKKSILMLDYVDGNPNNKKLSNLRFLCPNHFLLYGYKTIKNFENGNI